MPCGAPDQHAVTASPQEVLQGQDAKVTVLVRLEPCYPDESSSHDVVLYARPAGTGAEPSVVAAGRTGSDGTVTFNVRPQSGTEYSDLESFAPQQNGPRVVTVKVGGGRRLAAQDRYGTAGVVAQAAGFDAADTATVLVRGDDFADALAGSAAAALGDGGPLLLTQKTVLPEATKLAMSQLDMQEVTILGGTSAVGPEVEAELRSRGINPTRISGTNRYETARAVARSVLASGGSALVNGKRTIFVVNGSSFGDAITLGPMAYSTRSPVLLVQHNAIPSATSAALEDATAAGKPYEQAVIVGGTAVVSDEVASALAGRGLTIVRLAGVDRAATSAVVAEFGLSTLEWISSHVNIARGDAFADALAGGPHAGQERAPILLARAPDTLTESVRAYLEDNASAITSIDVLGGSNAISDPLIARVREAAGV